MPSFVAPAVSSAVASSTSAQPASLVGRSTRVSSNRTAPPMPPAGLIGAYGTTCFWPLSATAANHAPRFGRRRNARIAGFSPFDQFA